MAIKKEVVISASKWWFRNVYVKNMQQHMYDYVSARNEWLKSQGICGVVKNGVRENNIPYRFMSGNDLMFFSETEEEEIIFILKWQ